MMATKSRKERIREERQDQINHENRLLYKKMTDILKHGAGNVSPGRQRVKTQGRAFDPKVRRDSIMLHYGRSVTEEPSNVMMKRF